jgi:hypothetical protein
MGMPPPHYFLRGKIGPEDPFYVERQLVAAILNIGYIPDLRITDPVKIDQMGLVQCAFPTHIFANILCKK